MKNIYIASCEKGGGIYRYSMSDDGMLTFADKTPLDFPMYMAKTNGRMYVVLRAPYTESDESGVCSFKIEADGSLSDRREHGGTKGKVACHILVDDGEIYCVNYVSGSVIKLPDTLVVHEGCGPHPTRQESAHTHYVGLTPDKKYICVTDLGLDTVFVYNKDLSLHSKARVPSGHGARHLIFSEDGKYMFCANELTSTLSVFSYEGGELTLIDTENGLGHASTDKENTAAAIRLCDGKIYVSNRGDDSVSEFTFDGKKLTLVRCIPCFGNSPRDFDIFGDHMICTNESSDSVTVLDMKKGCKLIQTLDVPRALNVIEY